MKNIYLVGFMGTGKSVAGRILSEKLGKKFIEMDSVIEERQSQAINDIFKTHGEKHFRKLERQLLIELSSCSDLVISCGGGLICNSPNLKILKDSGRVICLTASPESIYERTKGSKGRPLLNVDNPVKKIKELLEKRLPYYRKADFLIDTDELTPPDVAGKILEVIRNG